MSLNKIWFTVEQGSYSPRDNAWGFRFYGHFASHAEAVKEARRIKNSRVLKVEQVAQVGCKVEPDALPDRFNFKS